MLKGKNINLRLMEREELPLFHQWVNNPEYMGEYNPLSQTSLMEMEQRGSSNPFESHVFFIEKKDGDKVGYISHFFMLHPAMKLVEIGYLVIPNERGKGYCSEAIKVMVDYLFLSKDITRIQAHTDSRNTPSQRTLERNGFRREGAIRKQFFMRGEWIDSLLYSILREEWKEPEVLTIENQV